MKSESPVAYLFHILGRVQGVGYRAWVKHEADIRNISGWVRNRQDGSVEALAYGRPEDVHSLYEACLDGPRASRVEKIIKKATEPPKDGGFRHHPTI